MCYFLSPRTSSYTQLIDQKRFNHKSVWYGFCFNIHATSTSLRTKKIFSLVSLVGVQRYSKTIYTSGSKHSLHTSTLPPLIIINPHQHFPNCYFLLFLFPFFFLLFYDFGDINYGKPMFYFLCQMININCWAQR